MLQKLIYVYDESSVALDLYLFGVLIYHKRVQQYAIDRGYTPQVK
jgi:hypothetical protein